MMNASQQYCGDAALQGMLKKVGSPRTIHEIYGLFYGCLGATRLVMPSEYLPIVLGEDKSFETLEEANQLLSNLMALWNTLARCTRPGTTCDAFPAVRYPKTPDGFKQRIINDRSIIDYFMKGLDLGETLEEDFSENALDALEELAGIMAGLERYEEVLETDPKAKEEPTAESLRIFVNLEKSIIMGFGVIIDDLRSARESNVEAMATSAGEQTKSKKIGRNDPCPCGSGKKYKKCCARSE